MPPVEHDVSKTELALLEILWEHGECTRREIADVLYPGGKESHYATVQKLLERLQHKGFVKQRRDQRVLYFSPTIRREDLIQRRLRDVAEQLCGNSVTPLLMNLVQAKPLSAEEIDELRALLDDLRKNKKVKKGSGSFNRNGPKGAAH